LWTGHWVIFRGHCVLTAGRTVGATRQRGQTVTRLGHWVCIGAIVAAGARHCGHCVASFGQTVDWGLAVATSMVLHSGQTVGFGFSVATGVGPGTTHAGQYVLPSGHTVATGGQDVASYGHEVRSSGSGPIFGQCVNLSGQRVCSWGGQHVRIGGHCVLIAGQ
jgi:hypothetical protein